MPHTPCLSARPAAVAGRFYPDDPQALRSVLAQSLRKAVVSEPDERPVRALIAPHAGYVYSGPIAGSAYRLLETRKPRIRRVILIGPSHYVAFAGLAVPDVEAFDTPLGRVLIDHEAREKVLGAAAVVVSGRPHANEHSLEVHLPFLQFLLGDFLFLPLLASAAAATTVAQVIERAWAGDDMLIIVSSDLSHYLDYASARQLDAATGRAIVSRSTALGGTEACGCVAINGLMALARRRNLEVHQLDLRNSGDTAGERARVVGYGAYALYDADPANRLISHGQVFGARFADRI